MGWKIPDGRHAALWIGALAAVVRVAHLLDYARLPLFHRPSVDAALYMETAQRLADSWVLPEVFFKPPLFPYALGAWLRCVGLDFFWLRFPFALLGAVTAILTWMLARRLFDARIALLAGIFQALQRTAVFFDGELLEVGLATCLQLGSLVALLHATRAPRQRWLVVSGLLLGLGGVARPSFLAWVVVGLVWLGRRHWRPAFVGVLLAVAPVTLHNAFHGRDFVLVTSNFGLNFYLGNNAWANGRIAPAPELPGEPARARATATAIAENAAGRALRPSQVSRFWFERGLAFIASAPARSAALVGRKLFYVWSGTPISDNEDLRGLPHYLWVERLLPVGMWLLAPLGLLGLLRARTTDRRALRLVQSYVWVQVLVLLPFFVVERFRLPWTPVLAVFAAWSCFTLAATWHRRAARWRFAMLAAVCMLVCNLPLFDVRAAPAMDMDYRLGYAYQQEGHTAAALAAFERAVARRPDAALARNALGTLLGERGERLDDAAALIESALQLDPTYAAHFAESLAMVELQRGDAGAAERAVARGLAAAPDPPLRAALLLRRAEAARLLGRRDDAIAAAEAALALAPAPATRERATALLRALDATHKTGTKPP